MTKLAKEALLKPEQLEILKELFPQAVVDGKVDFVSLKALLGEQVEGSNEKYQFTWNGKQNSIANAQKPSLGTLREDKASSKDFDTTENLYIEGDNLEVLKLLQKTYQGKIKMIYIDPPYNTGNDFVYKDDFKDNVKNYLELTNQKNKSNAETSGRYHTDWLNMMYPRLMLAKNLLTDDGVIFISIDDNEQANLKKMCDEIFGEMNYVNTFIWVNNLKGRQISNSGAAKTYEYILVYSKEIQKIEPFEISNLFASKEMPLVYSEFKYKVQSDEIGQYVIKNELFNTNSIFNEKTRPNLVFNIHYNPKNNEVKFSDYDSTIEYEGFIKLTPHKNANKNFKYHAWRWSKEKIINDKNDLYFLVERNSFKIFTKIRNIDLTTFKDLITNIGNGNSEVESLFSTVVFDFSKSTNLIKLISKLIRSTDNTILDFFSGSGTTAHAVMKLNAEDGGNRKFIMVQLPEKTEEDSEAYKAGYKNICEIGKERIRRAGEKVKQEMLEKDSSADVGKLDIGFKVFKLDSTNIKPWDGTQDIQQSLLEASGNVVKQDRTDLDVVHELMLMYGVFNEEIKEVNINGKTLYSIGNHFLVVCLFNTITKQDIEAIIKLKPKNVIFNDAGFENDNVKINAELTLKNHGVEDIKSL